MKLYLLVICTDRTVIGSFWLKLNSVVGKLREMSPSKRLPLIILHKRRVTGGPATNPKNKMLLEFWKKSGALYTTPAGSNDDW